MHKYFVEFLGTLFVVFIMLVTDNWLAIGCALAIAFVLTQQISGGMLNPATTLAFYAANKLPKYDVIPYILVQMLGGLVAYHLYKMYVI